MSQTILVTGATGRVGQQLIDRLLEADAPVIAAARRAESVHDRHPDVAFRRLDFQDAATFGPALEGVERVFLMRPPAISRIRPTIAPFIDAAAAAGVGQIVFLSIQGAESNRLVPHHRIERHIMASGVGWTMLRPSFFMQNLSTTHRLDIRNKGQILVPAGKGRTNFVDTRDVAAVAARVLTEQGHEGQAYELTGSQSLDYDEVATIFSRVLGRPIIYTNPSPWTFIRQMRAQGHSWPFVLVMLALYTSVRFGQGGRTTNKVRQLLGRPPIELEQFVRDHRACWLPPSDELEREAIR